MPGTYVFKPIEANLTHNTDLLGKMNPYCVFLVGQFRVRGEVCKKGGKHPHWNDAITIPMENESQVMAELMDKDRFSPDDSIGTFMVDLQEIQSKKEVTRWYPLTYNNKPAGEILMESSFQPPKTLNYARTKSLEGDFIDISQHGLIQEQEEISTQAPIVQEEQISLEQTPNIIEGAGVFIEQRQVVEPRTFTKAVDVVETRPVMKEIEVLEPVKVIKEVQYTEAVPVRKQIEVIEPEVVVKNVEVIEPRVVTKQIQVVENVPVKKEIEVIEPRTYVKEVNTFEPQTFTKQVEVIEQVPVLKQVTATEPVTVTKAVDFVEPIITTKTITKEIQQPLIVDEKVTTTVGPSTVVGVKEHTFVEKSDEMMTSGEKRYVEGEQIGEYSSPSPQTSQQIGMGENKNTFSSPYVPKNKKFSFNE